MLDETTPHPAQALERKLVTILCADIAGYSQMMGANEERTVRVFRGHREIFESLVSLHHGRVFNTAGDALLVEFNSAVEAVRCATEIQAALHTRNEHLPPEERMRFRIGINLGDVIVQGNDLLGDGVNVAARIQAATEPGGICISGSVHDQIQNKLSLDFKLLGEQTYKNIAKPVRTYTISEGAAVTRPAHRFRGWSRAALAGLALTVAGAAYWSYRQFDASRADQVRIAAELTAQLAAQQRATQEAQRVAENARRDAELQAQKQTAEDALRHAQEERTRLDQQRKQLESEQRSFADARKQAETGQRTAAAAAPSNAPNAPAVPGTPKSPASTDGSYSGQLCNQTQLGQAPAPFCWPVVLVVRNGVVEGSWENRAKKLVKVRGTLVADGSVQLAVTGWTPDGMPAEAKLRGRFSDGSIAASGLWTNGPRIDGTWKRTHSTEASPATAAKDAARETEKTVPSVVNSAYQGKLCSYVQNKDPKCWPVELMVRDGLVEGNWTGGMKKAAQVRGSVAVDGSVRLKLSAWTRKGTPMEAVLQGRIAGDALTVSSSWNNGVRFTGEWKLGQ